MKRIFATLVVIVVAALAVSGVVRFWPHSPLDAALTSAEAPPTLLVCYGYVDNRQGQILLQPARSGRVVKVLVKEKQTVSKDTPLVQLDDHLVRLQEHESAVAVQAAQLQLARARDGVKQYEARRDEAEAAVEGANSKVHAAQFALNRMTSRFAEQVELDMGQAQIDAARAVAKVEKNKLTELLAVDPELDVKQAQVQLTRSQEQLKQAQQECGEYLLRAPVNGRVLRVQAQEGDLVGPASPRPAIWLAHVDAWIVRAEVSQEFAGRVQQALDVQVEDEASAAVLANGRIAEVSDWFLPRRQFDERPTGINTGLSLECVIDLHEGHAPLRLGQRVRVRILADQRGHATAEN